MTPFFFDCLSFFIFTLSLVTLTINHISMLKWKGHTTSVVVAENTIPLFLDFTLMSLAYSFIEFLVLISFEMINLAFVDNRCLKLDDLLKKLTIICEKLLWRMFAPKFLQQVEHETEIYQLPIHHQQTPTIQGTIKILFCPPKKHIPKWLSEIDGHTQLIPFVKISNQNAH